MKIQIHFSGYLVLLLLLFAFLPTQAQETPKRDLKFYDDGGKFDFGWATDYKTHQEMKPRLREFLWTHWSRKKLGRVSAVFYTYEGDPTTTTYYIEPNKNGQWIIVAEYKQICCVLYQLEKKKRKPITKFGKDIYEIIDRIERNDKLAIDDISEIVPTTEQREPNLYLLRLRKRGEENNNLIFGAFVL